MKINKIKLLSFKVFIRSNKTSKILILNPFIKSKLKASN